MASHAKKLNEPNQPSTNTTKQLVDTYSGVGKQFKVKFVGSDNVSRKRGDAEAAKYAILSLKNAVKQMKTHKPRAVLGLTLKGMSIFEEQTKNTTRVPLQKVIYVAHDCEDACFFGIIVGSKESHTGFKLYCYKAEQKTAVSFVRSSQELFSLMYKLKKAKQQIKQQREGTITTEETDQKDEGANETLSDNTDNTPADIIDLSLSDSAPPPSYGSVTDQPWPSDIQKPSEANQEQRQKAIDEWNKLENELTDIAKELNLGDDQKPRPGEKGVEEHTYTQVKKNKSPQQVSSAGASDVNELEAIFGGEALQSAVTTTQTSAESQIMFNLNPFQEGNLSPAQTTTPFDSNFPTQVTSSPNSSSTSPPQVEPSIAFDLAELFQAPVGGHQPTADTTFGNPFAQPAPVGNPLSGPMGGPVGGPMGGPIGGPMGGPLGGPIGGPVGSPMGGMVGGRPIGIPGTAPMGMALGTQPPTQMAHNPFSAFQNTGAAVPQQSGDIFSSANDAFMQSGFAAPLLPEPSLQPGVRKPGANPSLQPERYDAFADLVSIAKSMPEKGTPSIPPETIEPKPSMMDMIQKKEQSVGKLNPDMLLAFREATDSGSHQMQPLPSSSQQAPSSAPPPASSMQNWVGFGNDSGDQVTAPAQPPASSQSNWMTFDDGFSNQFNMPTQPPPPATVPQANAGSAWVSF